MLNKFQLQNLAWTSTSKSWPALCSKSEQKFSFGTKCQLSNFYKLLPTRSSASTWATVTNSTSFELASSHARVTSIKFTKQQWVSESVSYWQAFPMIGLGSDKNNDNVYKGNAWTHWAGQDCKWQSTTLKPGALALSNQPWLFDHCHRDRSGQNVSWLILAVLLILCIFHHAW